MSRPVNLYCYFRTRLDTDALFDRRLHELVRELGLQLDTPTELLRRHGDTNPYNTWMIVLTRLDAAQVADAPQQISTMLAAVGLLSELTSPLHTELFESLGKPAGESAAHGK